MNVYECDGTDIFMRCKWKCYIQCGVAKLKERFIFHLMKISVLSH